MVREGLAIPLNIMEQLHQHFAFEVLRIMRDVEKYPEWEECLPEIESIINTVLDQEFAWNDYLFEGRQMLGLNKNILADAIRFFALPVYIKLGLKPPFSEEEATVNPIKHLIDYFDTSMIQTASQEIQQTGYITGSLYDDGWKTAEVDYSIN